MGGKVSGGHMTIVPGNFLCRPLLLVLLLRGRGQFLVPEGSRLAAYCIDGRVSVSFYLILFSPYLLEIVRRPWGKKIRKARLIGKEDRGRMRKRRRRGRSGRNKGGIGVHPAQRLRSQLLSLKILESTFPIAKNIN